MSAPLVAGDTALGALKVYAAQPGSFDAHSERLLTLAAAQAAILVANAQTRERAQRQSEALRADRKSTRLNSSHANISYAVFCLKKKDAGMRRTHVCSHVQRIHRL